VLQPVLGIHIEFHSKLFRLLKVFGLCGGVNPSGADLVDSLPLGRTIPLFEDDITFKDGNGIGDELPAGRAFPA
jgi:hypothetical protein